MKSVRSGMVAVAKNTICTTTGEFIDPGGFPLDFSFALRAVWVRDGVCCVVPVRVLGSVQRVPLFY